MKTIDFLKQHKACRNGAKWALAISDDMVAVWDALVNQSKHDWLLWTATRPNVFPDSILRRLACRFVRETPLVGGGTVWDRLTDERSRRAVEVAERYADGDATTEELAIAYAAAYAAARAAADAAYSDVGAATRAARAADRASADAAAHAAGAAAWAANATADAACAAARSAYRAADLAAAWAATDANAAATAASAAARATAHAAGAATDTKAAACASSDAAELAQIKMICALGNPFEKGKGQ